MSRGADDNEVNGSEVWVAAREVYGWLRAVPCAQQCLREACLVR